MLQRAFGRGYHVRVSAPIALDSMSEPEPDLAVIHGAARDYVREHPATPVLLVGVADASLAKDHLRKSGLYARAGIGDYWIVNAMDEVLEVYREPKRSPGRRYGWQYGSVRVLTRDAAVAPLAAPGKRIPVAELLPRR